MTYPAPPARIATRAELEARRAERIHPDAPEGATIGAMLDAWADMMTGTPADRAAALGLTPGTKVHAVRSPRR